VSGPRHRRRPRVRAIGLVVAATLVSAVPGCGGGNDREDAEKAVREFARAANERNADKLCGELVTEEFVEMATLATGEAARKACREGFADLNRPQLEIVSFEKTEIDGDRAIVTTRVNVGEEPRVQVFELAKEGGKFRVNSGSPQQ
jgi:hypothetical protein